MIVALWCSANWKCTDCMHLHVYVHLHVHVHVCARFYIFSLFWQIVTVVMLEAMYDYTAQDVEELSFPEGAMIRLLRTDENGVDDGWWEGSYEGKVGVFPSVVVEVVSGDIDLLNQVS